MPKKFRELEKIPLDDGWRLVDVSGSHYQYEHPKKPGKVTLPHHPGDIPARVEKNILKQAGIQ